MAKKSSAAVSSWGFSGYLTVLPKETKASADKAETEQNTENPKDKQQAAANGR